MVLVLSPRESTIVKMENSAFLHPVGTFLVDSNESISHCLLMKSVRLMLGAIGVKSKLELENAPFLRSRAVYSVCIRRWHMEAKRTVLFYQ